MAHSAAVGVRWRPSALLARAIAFVVLAAAFGTWAVLSWQQQPAIFDDAYISFRYAQNLVDGHGLVYNPGERVEGYTNFLWVLYAAAGIALSFHPLPWTATLGVSAWVGCIVLCAYLIAFHIPKKRRALAAAPLLAVLILPSGLAQVAGSGLETLFVGFVLLAHGVTAHLARPTGHLGRLMAGLLPLSAFLTRMDAAVVLAVSALVMFGADLFQPGSFMRRLLPSLMSFLPLALGGAAFLAFRAHYYGELLPNTYYAKHASDFMPAEAGWEYLRAFLRSYPCFVLLVPCALASVWATRGAERRFAVYAVLSSAAWLAYVVRVGGDFMQYRFMWELAPLFVAASLLGVATLRAPLIAALAGLTLLLSPLPPVLENRFGMQSIEDMDRMAREGVRVGRALAELPDDTIVATTLAGTTAYYSGLTIIDQWGLNDAYVGRMEVRGFGGRGHVKFAPEEYLAARGVHLYMAHPVFSSCDKPRREYGKSNVFIRTRGNECVRTWYFQKSESLTAFVCAHPQRYILHDVDCPAPVAAPSSGS